MDDLISRKKILRLMERAKSDWNFDYNVPIDRLIKIVRIMPPDGTEIVRCKDCKFYTPMNRETKTGICSLLIHQNFGDDWYCAGAERRTDGTD